MSTSTCTEAPAGDESSPGPSSRHELTLRVTAVTWEAEGVVGLTLGAVDGADLPEWAPGAHLEVRLPSGLNRQYSLCGDPADRRSYQVAVRLEDEGRGGSAEVHSTALVGRSLLASPPRSHFALRAAPHHLLIAGGIGITPLLPMAAALHRRGAGWSMLYLGHGAATMPFLDTVHEFGADHVRVVDTAVDGRPDLDGVIGDRPGETVTYCCGPKGLIDAVAGFCEAGDLRYEVERFGAADAADTGHEDGEVQLELRRSGKVFTVPSGTTLLEAIRDAGVIADSDCEEGYCGTCEVAVLGGTPDHRDVVLSKAERANGRSMMPCVSRASTPTLVLDL